LQHSPRKSARPASADQAQHCHNDVGHRAHSGACGNRRDSMEDDGITINVNQHCSARDPDTEEKSEEKSPEHVTSSSHSVAGPVHDFHRNSLAVSSTGSRSEPPHPQVHTRMSLLGTSQTKQQRERSRSQQMTDSEMRIRRPTSPSGRGPRLSFATQRATRNVELLERRVREWAQAHEEEMVECLTPASPHLPLPGDKDGGEKGVKFGDPNAIPTPTLQRVQSTSALRIPKQRQSFWSR
jgi:hypothetical protein